jgi:uncharacterized membrane protein YhaH (DUF805 family)
MSLINVSMGAVMNFPDAIKSFFVNYVTFSGRSARSEYWYVALGALIVGLVLGVVAVIVHTQILTCLFELAIIVPSLALVSRRLHDVDRSFWWALLGFIPIVGGIILIVWYCTKGTTGDNRFGPDPLAAQLVG